MQKKFTLGFVVAVGFFIAVFWGITSRAYPVATVNGSVIPVRLFQIASTAAQTYYGQMGSLHGLLASTTDAVFESQMRQLALQALIEDQLVINELGTIYETEPLQAAVALRVSEALASSSERTPEAISEIFGITVEEFGEVVLAPRARIELIAKELAKSGVDFETWLQAQLAVASVDITVKDLTWGENRVELTGERSYTAEVKEIFNQFASTTEALQSAANVSSSPEDDVY